MSLKEILVETIERLQKNHGMDCEFIVIARERTTGTTTYCMSPMSVGHAKDLCKCLPFM